MTKSVKHFSEKLACQRAKFGRVCDLGSIQSEFTLIPLRNPARRKQFRDGMMRRANPRDFSHGRREMPAFAARRFKIARTEIVRADDARMNIRSARAR
jgi:hypothetical protein